MSYNDYVIHRIMSKSVDMPNGCREWVGTKNKKGYGIISTVLTRNAKDNGRIVTSAHRAHYMAVYGALPKNVFVCHTCDNPSCVRIDHLFPGSCSDNMHDMTAKGRMKPRSGDKKKRKRRSIYTDVQVEKIKDFLGDWRRAAFEIGMSENYAWKIRNGRSKRVN